MVVEPGTCGHDGKKRKRGSSSDLAPTKRRSRFRFGELLALVTPSTLFGGPESDSLGNCAVIPNLVVKIRAVAYSFRDYSAGKPGIIKHASKLDTSPALSIDIRLYLHSSFLTRRVGKYVMV